MADLLVAVTLILAARSVDKLGVAKVQARRKRRSKHMATPRCPKYDDDAHAERIRKLLSKRIATMPLKALVKLQEVAALLEAGERLDVLVARERLGKRRGKVQVQKREDVDRGQRTSFAQAVEDLADQDAERAAIGASVASRRVRFDIRRNLS